MPDVQRNDEFWENLGITFSVPSEADFDEILDFYLREFVPGSSIHVFFFKKMGLPRPLFVYFCLFNQTLQFLQQMEVKKWHSNWCWESNPRPSEHESPPKTTRPRLPPLVHS